MKLDFDQFKQLVALAFDTPDAKLSRGEAEAIVTIAGLAVDVDQHEDASEVSLFDSLASHVCALAGISGNPVEAPVRAVDDALGDQLREIGQPLRGKPSGKLAYIVGYLLAVVDQQLAPEESDFVEMLRYALDLDEPTSDELAAEASGVLTGE